MKGGHAAVRENGLYRLSTVSKNRDSTGEVLEGRSGYCPH